MSSDTTTAVDARFVWRDIIRFILATAPIFAVVALINTAVDPLHLIHRGDVYAVSNELQRWTNAGRIRTAPPFDAAVVGSSYVGNFDPARIAETFGARAQVFSVFGASNRETMLTLTYLLEKRPSLKYVLFEASIWNVCNESWHPMWEFPLSLYDDSEIGLLRYLFAGETMRLTLSQWFYRADIYNAGFSKAEVNAHRWYEQQASRFSNPPVIDAVLKRDLPNPPGDRMSDQQIDASAQATLGCMAQMLAVAARYPKTKFFIFNPPVLQYLLWYRGKLGLIEAWNKAQEVFAARLPLNVRYFDFYAALEIENDCRRFIDVAHFDSAASDQMTKWMHDGIFERTATSNAAISSMIRDGIKQPAPCPLPANAPSTSNGTRLGD